MRIVRAEIFDIYCVDRPQWHPVFIRLHTDEGITGVGEAGLAYDVGHSAAAAMLKELAEGFLPNADPLQTEKLWQRMLRESFWGLGGGPVLYAAMSAIDTAFWDIKGKALGVPVYQLLGGKTNERLRTYASQLQFGWSTGVQTERLCKPQDYARVAEQAMSEGYDCVKLDPILYNAEGQTQFDCTKPFRHNEIQLFRARLAAVRKTIGDQADIILECHSLPGVSSALQLGELAEEFRCLYYEEPVNYLNSALHEKLSRLNVPLAAGERLYLRHGVRPYIEAQTIDVLQPDIGLCGGITEAKKICDYADLYDIKVQAHVCGGPVATAAALHLETAIPNFLIHEHHVYALKDWNRNLCVPDFQPENGFFVVPEAPGLGVELNDKVVMRSLCGEVKF